MGWGTGNLGGGGTSLNFKVVGGLTQPANPQENTIWVATDTKITSSVFDISEPAEPSEGMVWVKTGSYSSAPFNALKKNGIVVYPVSARQYIGGSWMDVVAKSYQGGSWVDWFIWDGELFLDGNQFEEYTGGWKPYNYKPSGSGSTAEAPELTVENDELVLFQKGGSGSYYRYGTVFTEKEIDVSSYNSIEVVISDLVSDTKESERNVNVLIPSKKETGYTQVASLNAKKAGTYSLDISSVTGKRYIAIGIGGMGYDCTVKIKSVKME